MPRPCAAARPPGHPAFPSGHAFLGHFVALLLLEIGPIAERYGIFEDSSGTPGQAPGRPDVLAGHRRIKSPLLWLAQRIAKNRERMGVHYPSDSFASRHLAAGIWWALLHAQGDDRILCPTLHGVLRRAQAEWPSRWA